MKKQGWILIGITGAFLVLLTGVFLGRNLTKGYIPIQNIANTQTQPTEETKPLYDGNIDINTANLQQLQLLPNIAETLAQRIIDYRTENGNFVCIEDLMKVPGIGEKRFDALRDYVKVG